jgi:hypothetical protein
LAQHGCSVAAEVRQIDTNGEGKGIEAPSNNAQVFKVKTVGTILNDSAGIEQEILVCNLYSYDGDITGTTDIPVRAAAMGVRAVGDILVGVRPEGGTGLVWADSGTEVQWTEGAGGGTAGGFIDLFNDGTLIVEDATYLNATSTFPIAFTFSEETYVDVDGNTITGGAMNLSMSSGSPLQVLSTNGGGIIVWDWVRAH